MFIDIWDKENKAIKINEFSKDLNSSNDKKYNNAVIKILSEYWILREEDTIKTDYYQIHFHSEDENGFKWFKDTLNFLTLFDCFTFLLSDSFEYLFESESINFIKIQAGNKTMFSY